MSDDEENRYSVIGNRRWYIKGLIQINAEDIDKITKDRFSPIKELGLTDPYLKIPEKNPATNIVIPKGWKRLTAIYDDNEREKYLGSLRRTMLFYGAKVWINCPCTFVDKKTRKVTLKADLFANNRKVPDGCNKNNVCSEKRGYGYFFVGSIRVSHHRQYVKNGHVEETVTLPKDIEIIDRMEYSFVFEFSEHYLLAPDKGTGIIFTKTVSKGKTPLTVEVPTIITHEGLMPKLIARVYHTNHGKYVNYPDDLPSGGYITFYVDGKKIGSSNITTSGFATHALNLTTLPTTPRKDGIGYGVHNITAVYVPDTEELQKKYERTQGCGSLFIGKEDTNRPYINSITPLCTHRGNSNFEITFTSNKPLNGKVQLIMDLIPVKLYEDPIKVEYTEDPDYLKTITEDDLVEVKDKDGNIQQYKFKLNFDTIGQVEDTNHHWLFSGYHNLMLKYMVYDNFYSEEGEYYPMEYYYYLNDFYMQIPVHIELVGKLDTNSQTMPNGSRVYVGNNLHRLIDKTNTTDNNNTMWYAPGTNRPTSTTIGNIIQVRVVNNENEGKLVEGGKLKFTFVSRTENNNIGNNIGDTENGG